MKKYSDYIFIILVTIFGFSIFVFFERTFIESLSVFTQAILSAVLGSIIITASMVIMMRFQTRVDKEKEFSSTLFERKLLIYEKLLSLIFEMDDDNIISKNEVQDIENHIGLACLVANQNLVSMFSQFLVQLKFYGVLYCRSMTDRQKEHFRDLIDSELKKNKSESFLYDQKKLISLKKNSEIDIYFLSLDQLIQEIRKDLSVVEGDVQSCIEHFIMYPYDKYNMVKNPNYVDG